MLPEADLRDLIGRIARGESKAMERFYRACESRIYRFAKSRLNDSFAASDILHETMIEVWKGAGRFQGRSQVMTWVLGIAQHKVIDVMRRQSRFSDEEPDENLADAGTPTPEAAIAGASDSALLHDCLSRLSEKHRAVLHLAFFEDMAYDQIAQVVGCPEGTVKTRVFHAKEALKKCLVRKKS